MKSFIYWDQSVFRHHLRYEDEDKSFDWSSGTQYWELVMSYLNHDYGAIARDKDSVLPYGMVDNATEPSSNVPLKEWLARQVELDLSELDYSTFQDIVEKVFLNEAFPELSASQKYYAYVEAHRCMDNGIVSLKKAVDTTATLRLRYELVDAVLTPAFTMVIPDVDDEKNRTIDRMFALACEDLMGRLDNDKAIAYGYTTVFSSLHDTAIYLLHEMIKKNCVVKICPNCNRYFVPQKRADTIYCTYSSPQMPSKTCQEYVKYSKSLEKSQTDDATRIYRQIYNAKNNKLRRCGGKNVVLRDDLNAFILQANQWKSEVRNGTKTKEEYVGWLHMVKERKAM